MLQHLSKPVSPTKRTVDWNRTNFRSPEHFLPNHPSPKKKQNKIGWQVRCLIAKKWRWAHDQSPHVTLNSRRTVPDFVLWKMHNYCYRPKWQIFFFVNCITWLPILEALIDNFQWQRITSYSWHTHRIGNTLRIQCQARSTRWWWCSSCPSITLEELTKHLRERNMKLWPR